MYNLKNIAVLLVLSASALAGGPYAPAFAPGETGPIQEMAVPKPTSAAAPAPVAAPAPAPAPPAPAPVAPTTTAAPVPPPAATTAAAAPGGDFLEQPGSSVAEPTTAAVAAAVSSVAAVVSNIVAPVPVIPTTLVPTAPEPTVAPVPVPAPAGNNGGGMTIQVINSFTDGLSVSYADNAGGPGAIGSPTAGALGLGSTTTLSYPTGWAGRIYVGSGPVIDPAGSKIEGSTTGGPDIDVSYVDGYSVPIVCSAGGVPESGCNIDLFTSGVECPDLVNGVCHNPAQNVANGPAPPFFVPCVGAAYTFPNDNVANRGDLADNVVVCVIGTSVLAPERQGKMPNVPTKRDAAQVKKRAVQNDLQRAARQEQRLRARAANMFSKGS